MVRYQAWHEIRSSFYVLRINECIGRVTKLVIRDLVARTRLTLVISATSRGYRPPKTILISSDKIGLKIFSVNKDIEIVFVLINKWIGRATKFVISEGPLCIDKLTGLIDSHLKDISCSRRSITIELGHPDGVESQINASV